MADENGEPTDDLVPVVLDYAHKYNLKVTFHIEPYKDRDDRSMYHNVKYIIDSIYYILCSYIFCSQWGCYWLNHKPGDHISASCSSNSRGN